MVNQDVIDSNLLSLTIIVTVGMQLSFFAIAYWFRFDKVTDLAGSSNFIVLAWLTYLVRGTYFSRQTIVTILVTVWGLRLGSFLVYRVLSRGKDDRFDTFRDNFCMFLGFWVMQIIWVWVVSLPVIFLNAAIGNPDLNARDYIGWALWGLGFIIEAIADQSKHNFLKTGDTKNTWLATGIWKYSRHPNYFGEIVLWTGIFITCSSVFEEAGSTKYAYFSLFSPVMTFVFLMFFSGVPPAEERYDLRFGKNPKYIEYKNMTSPLVPLPTSLYAAMPSFFKCLCCFEYPLYSRALHKARDEKSPLNDA